MQANPTSYCRSANGDWTSASLMTSDHCLTAASSHYFTYEARARDFSVGQGSQPVRQPVRLRTRLKDLGQQLLHSFLAQARSMGPTPCTADVTGSHHWPSLLMSAVALGINLSSLWLSFTRKQSIVHRIALAFLFELCMPPYHLRSEVLEADTPLQHALPFDSLRFIRNYSQLRVPRSFWGLEYSPRLTTPPKSTL